jgi:hypothetical protein
LSGNGLYRAIGRPIGRISKKTVDHVIPRGKLAAQMLAAR